MKNDHYAPRFGAKNAFRKTVSTRIAAFFSKLFSRAENGAKCVGL
jgi:hypothetical protein